MSLGEELKTKYRVSVCESESYKEELNRLKMQLLKTAETHNYYELKKEEYPKIMSDRRMLESWLNENELIFSGVCNDKAFINLSIEW